MLSLVIPVYNQQKKLHETFETLRQAVSRLNEPVPYEVILVNDASDDNTGPLCDQLAASDPHVRVLHLTTNVGSGRAFLAACKIAKYTRVTVTRGDDYFSVDFVQNLFTHANAAAVVFQSVSNLAIRASHRIFFSKLYNLIYRYSFQIPLAYIHSTPIYNVEFVLGTPLKSERNSVFSELAVKSLLLGLPFVEISGTIKGNQHSKKVSNHLRVLKDSVATYFRLLFEVYIKDRKLYTQRRTRIPSAAPQMEL